MRIDRPFSGPNPARKPTQSPGKPTGAFRDALAASEAARRTEDTVELSRQTEEPLAVAAEGISPARETPVAEEAPPAKEPIAQAGQAPETVILPTDTTEMKLAKLRRIAEEADYTGMSYSEIFSAIWNRYNDAFDGNIEAITSCITVMQNGRISTIR